MYIRLPDGSLPKFVTCTSEAAFACGAPSVTTSPRPAAATIVTPATPATPAVSSALSHLFTPCPLLVPLGPFHPWDLPFHHVRHFEMFRMFLGIISPLLHSSAERSTRGQQ